jgi:hypothetical protein
MSSMRAPVVPTDAVERYLSRIEAHLARLADGHDPMGHLFGIERLARAARAEWRDEQRRVELERSGP